MTFLFLFLCSLEAGTDSHYDVLTQDLEGALLAFSNDDLDSWRESFFYPPEHDFVELIIEHSGGDKFGAFLMKNFPNVEVVERTGKYVQALVRYEDLEALSHLSGITKIRLPYHPTEKEIFSEGISVLCSDDVLETANGRGVNIAILDLGFDGYEELLGTELPKKVKTIFRSDPTTTNHGTAVAELIYDFAPKADITLYTFHTDVEFLAVLEEIGNSNIDLVTASIGFDNFWHADGSSPYTRAVDDLILQTGIHYVAASGNENLRYRVGNLEQEGEFVSIDGINGIWVKTKNGWASVSFRWSDPMENSTTDLDLIVYGEDGEFCGESKEVQEGREDSPYEYVYCNAKGEQAQVFIVSNRDNLKKFDGYLYSYFGLQDGMETGSRNLTLPGDTINGISVGAVEYSEYNGSNSQIAEYSSSGPTEDGRMKPDVVGIAGVKTVTTEKFSGTSASAPQIAGIIALALDKNKADPETVRSWLMDNTIDIEDSGWDDVSGAGLVHVTGLPEGCGCFSSKVRIKTWIYWVFITGALFLRRKSRC